MTHLSVLAITPRQPDEGSIYALLWPWCHSNPDLIYPRFDYFEVGGRFQSFIEARWASEDSERVWEFSRKQKKDLDIPALQARAVAWEAETYDGVQAALAGRKIPDPAELARTYGRRDWIDHWHTDAAVEAVRSVAGCLSPESIFSYAVSRPVALARASRRALLPSAIVQGDHWHEADLLDWDEDPARTETWAALAMRLVTEAEPDAWFTIVDCHR